MHTKILLLSLCIYFTIASTAQQKKVYLTVGATHAIPAQATKLYKNSMGINLGVQYKISKASKLQLQYTYLDFAPKTNSFINFNIDLFKLGYIYNIGHTPFYINADMGIAAYKVGVSSSVKFIAALGVGYSIKINDKNYMDLATACNSIALRNISNIWILTSINYRWRL
jgi:opacity protein-like surface antigen